MNLEKSTLKYIQKHQLVQKAQTVIIGVSGGPDSIALAVVLNELKHTLGIHLTIAHFNHNLRANSKKDQIFVKEFAESHNIPFVTDDWKNPKIKKVYMLNQNYVYGKAVQKAVAEYLKERAPHVELVGDDLMTPFGKVQDFTPYVAKIAAAKADAVITGNWGPDFTRFVVAVAGAGLDVEFYSIYAGIPTNLNAYGEEAGIKLKIKHCLLQPTATSH